MNDFENVWELICKNEMEIFNTKTGLEFEYRVEKETILPSRTNYKINKKEVEKAYLKMPLRGPGEISKIVRGPAYVYGILTDKRINR